MEPIIALHTAARRYCISLAPWLDPRAGEAEYNNPDTDWEHSGPGIELTRAEYWRQELMPAILRQIERKTPQDFNSLDELRTFLLAAGREAVYVPWEDRPSPYTIWKWSSVPPPEPEDLEGMTEERKRFCAYVAQLSGDDLRSVAPLPFRRTLSEDEANTIWKALHLRWPSYDLWFLNEEELQAYEHWDMEGVLTFWWFRFAQHVPLDALRTALKDAGVRRVWQVGDAHEEPYVVDIDTFVPQGEEAHFTSDGFDWVIYCDHESRIVLAGDRLVEMVRAVWADWERYDDEDYIEA